MGHKFVLAEMRETFITTLVFNYTTFDYYLVCTLITLLAVYFLWPLWCSVLYECFDYDVREYEDKFLDWVERHHPSEPVVPFNTECPICMNCPGWVLGLVTNCNHCFCGQCLKAACQQNYGGVTECPLCRQHLFRIKPLDPREFVNKEGKPCNPGLRRFVNNFNSMDRRPTQTRFTSVFKPFASAVESYVDRAYGPSWLSSRYASSVLTIAFIYMYVSCSDDIVADKWPIGYLDDFVVIVLFLVIHAYVF